MKDPRARAAEKDEFAPYVSKSVPQRLKAVVRRRFYGTAKPVPFVQRRFFPQQA